MIISCEQKVSTKTNKQLDTLFATHRIDFIDNRGTAFLTLDTVFNDCYFYNAADCLDYFDHCLKPKRLRKLQRGFFWSNVGDTLHHLILSYDAFDSNSLNITQKDSSKIQFFNEQPYIISKDTITSFTDENKAVTFLKMTARGKINVILITNQVPYSKIDKYFANIMQKAIIHYNFKPIDIDSFQMFVKQTDSANRKYNYR
jgi:hypothetical protein